MKMTIDISNELLIKAKEFAVKRRTTLSAIIEQGIRNMLKEQQSGEHYVLPDMSVGGNGLQADFRDKTWSDFRDAAHEGRGS